MNKKVINFWVTEEVYKKLIEAKQNEQRKNNNQFISISEFLSKLILEHKFEYVEEKPVEYCQYSRVHVVGKVLSLNVGEKIFVSMEEMGTMKAHYVYVAGRRKGMKILQKKLRDKSGYVFERVV